MAINSYKQDENINDVGKLKTLGRLFSYLLAHKASIVVVLLIMAYCVCVSLVNPLIIEAAIDNHISTGDYAGLYRLAAIALVLNAILILLVKARMYIMAKVCNKVLVTIRQQLYTHIQTLDFKFFDSRPTGKILARIIGDINSLKDVLSNSVTTLIPDFITICAVVGIMFVRNAKLAAAALISIPLMFVGVWFIQVRSHKRWQIFRKSPPISMRLCMRTYPVSALSRVLPPRTRRRKPSAHWSMSTSALLWMLCSTQMPLALS